RSPARDPGELRRRGSGHAIRDGLVPGAGMNEPAVPQRGSAEDERERIANERDRVADERDDIADQREATSDARDLLLDEKEKRLAALELRLDDRARSLRQSVPDVVRRQPVVSRARAASSPRYLLRRSTCSTGTKTRWPSAYSS